MRVTDVVCLSAITIHCLVLEWLDGMRLSYKRPAKCLNELQSPEQQHANTHRLFIKLCWLVDTHAVGADRVVNIDDTSYRHLPVHQTRWGRRGTKQAQLHPNTKDMLVQIVHAGKTDAFLPAQPWPERTHHVTSQNGWATTTTILQLAATLDSVLNPGKGGWGSRGSFSGTWPASTPARPHWPP